MKIFARKELSRSALKENFIFKIPRRRKRGEPNHNESIQNLNESVNHIEDGDHWDLSVTRKGYFGIAHTIFYKNKWKYWSLTESNWNCNADLQCGEPKNENYNYAEVFR